MALLLDRLRRRMQRTTSDDASSSYHPPVGVNLELYNYDLDTRFGTIVTRTSVCLGCRSYRSGICDIHWTISTVDTEIEFSETQDDVIVRCFTRRESRQRLAPPQTPPPSHPGVGRDI